MVNCEPYDLSHTVPAFGHWRTHPPFHAAVADSELYKFGAIKNFAN